VVVDQPAREADQDWRQGREPRPLRHVPNGQGRVATDVHGNLDVGCPTAGTAGARVTGKMGSNTTGGEGIGAT
jgi:hypothetical protein